MTESGRHAPFGKDIAEHFLELSGRSSDYALLLVGRDGLIRGWNSGAERLYGYESKEIVGRLFSELFSIEDAMQGISDHDLSAANDLGSSASLLWQTRKDGSTFHCSANVTAITDEDGAVRVFAVVVQDRHARELADEHATKTGELIDFYEANKTFFTMLAHDMRVPLAPICAALELVKLYEKEDSQSVRVADILQRQVEILKHLVNSMLDVSRFSLAKFTLQCQRVDLNSLVTKVAETFQRLANVESRVLHVDCSRGPVYVEVDSIRIEQVLSNLLENAIKYTDCDGEIRLSVSAEQGSAFVMVRDNGIGLKHCDIPEIFQVFTTHKDTVSPDSRGTHGLGMAIAKAIADLHGGSLTVYRNAAQESDSFEERGCEFVLQLPLSTASIVGSISDQTDNHEEEVEVPSESLDQTLRVLLLTDQLDYGLPLSMLLKANGCLVQWTQLPYDLEQVMRTFKPLVVLLDMSMKGANPFDIAARLSGSDMAQGLRLIALTDGDPIDSDVVRGRNSSIRSFVTKSAEFGNLRSALARTWQSIRMNAHNDQS